MTSACGTQHSAHLCGLPCVSPHQLLALDHGCALLALAIPQVCQEAFHTQRLARLGRVLLIVVSRVHAGSRSTCCFGMQVADAGRTPELAACSQP